MNAGALRITAVQEAPVTANQKAMMRTILEAVKTSMPEEFDKMRRTEKIASGPDNLTCVVRRDVTIWMSFVRLTLLYLNLTFPLFPLSGFWLSFAIRLGT